MFVRNFRVVGKGKLICGFDIFLRESGLMLHGLTLVDGNMGRFIGYPNREYEKDGETKRAYYVRFLDGFKEDIEKKIIAELDILLAKEGVEPTASQVDKAMRDAPEDLPF